MGKVIIPTSQRNVQLSEKERTCVYISTLTGRILGFGHESMKPIFTKGWKREVLYHAHDIERYAEQYRKQTKDDMESEDFRQFERDKEAHNSIRAALLERRNHVDANNRAYIDANLVLMDRREERMRKRRLAMESALVSEKYEDSKSSEDIALESSSFKSNIRPDATAAEIRDALRKVGA